MGCPTHWNKSQEDRNEQRFPFCTTYFIAGIENFWLLLYMFQEFLVFATVYFDRDFGLIKDALDVSFLSSFLSTFHSWVKFIIV